MQGGVIKEYDAYYFYLYSFLVSISVKSGYKTEDDRVVIVYELIGSGYRTLVLMRANDGYKFSANSELENW